MILGIDEVGRGVWAGPLVVGAVVLGGVEIEGLNDSKLLSKKRREQLYDKIYASGAGIGLGWVTPAEIDEVGLSAALRLATKRAVHDVGASFHEIIIDGTVNFLAETPLEQYVTLMKKADQLVPSVSAASIVAKVARDRYMAEQDAVYPGYKFAQHVGYGTAVHRAALAELGVTPLHRRSVAPVRAYCTNDEPVLQKDSTSLVESSASPKQPRLRRIFSRFASLSPAELPDGQTSSSGQEPKREKIGHSQIALDDADDSTLQHSTTRTIGDMSESTACAELERRGHEIVARNWKTKWCEIDIISKLDDCYYFTEVKHRKNDKAGDGLAAITDKKLNQMAFAAELFISKHKLQGYNRLLVAIATTGDPPYVTDLIKIS